MSALDFGKTLNEACNKAVMVDWLHIERIDVSPEGLCNLSRIRSEFIVFECPTRETPITWHGIEVRECHDLSGVTFNLITS